MNDKYKCRGESINKDHEICKALDICWHEVERHTNAHLPREFVYHCDACQTHFREEDKEKHANPDFTTDAGKIQLLKEMDIKLSEDDWLKFISAIYGLPEIDRGDDKIPLALLIGPDNCALRDMVWEFLEGKKE